MQTHGDSLYHYVLCTTWNNHSDVWCKVIHFAVTQLRNNLLVEWIPSPYNYNTEYLVPRSHCTHWSSQREKGRRATVPHEHITVHLWAGHRNSKPFVLKSLYHMSNAHINAKPLKVSDHDDLYLITNEHMLFHLFLLCTCVDALDEAISVRNSESNNLLYYFLLRRWKVLLLRKQFTFQPALLGVQTPDRLLSPIQLINKFYRIYLATTQTRVLQS